MAALVIYLVVLSASIGFFLWNVGLYLLSRQPARQAVNEIAVMRPEAEPALFALYCQYLLAPELAMQEAREALAALHAVHAVGQASSKRDAPADFYAILTLLQEKSPAPLL